MSKFSNTDIARKFSPEIIKYVEDVYSSKSKATLQERKSAYDIKETPEVRGLITYYLSYFVYNNDFEILITKEIFLREATDTIREPIETTDADLRLKLIDLKGKCNNHMNQLREEIDALRNIIFGDQDGSKEIVKALSAEDRLKLKKQPI